MPTVIPGRFTAQRDEPFVVFLIGMRINRFWQFKKWLPVVNAMPKMMQVLLSQPERGLLGSESFMRIWPLEIIMISYWRSFDDLEHFARSKDDPHLSAWQDYQRNIAADGTAGVWHETYLIEPGSYECVYANMPVFGLAAATTHIPAVNQRASARRRLQAGHGAEIVEIRS
ncbi:MAG: DUF4188 domain-containing protein [Anaerolineae bacterium]|nr:DUF4188 domain-containing protein [Anaerolineae bacterium]